MILLLLCVVLAAAFAYAWVIAARGFSAKDEPGLVESLVAPRLRRFGIPRKARDAKNPVAATPEVLAAAMEHFADHCAICHGNDGRGGTLVGKGLYPKAPDMTGSGTQQLTDGELYYIIENGVRLTGMPAFGEERGSLQNEESWQLVHFIRHLPSITEEELAEMKEMNPRSPGELRKEEDIRRFLEGEDSEPEEHSPAHHH